MSPFTAALLNFPIDTAAHQAVTMLCVGTQPFHQLTAINLLTSERGQIDAAAIFDEHFLGVCT